MSETKLKIFVIDTNVILHDATCIHNFQDNDIIISISVLEELDHFKKVFIWKLQQKLKVTS